MRAKLDAMRLNFANGCKAENLEPTAIGQNGTGPIDESMQTTRAAEDVEPGADREVIGVAQDDLSAHLAQFARVNGFDAALSAHRHEDRGINGSMRRL